MHIATDVVADGDCKCNCNGKINVYRGGTETRRTTLHPRFVRESNNHVFLGSSPISGTGKVVRIGTSSPAHATQPVAINRIGGQSENNENTRPSERRYGPDRREGIMISQRSNRRFCFFPLFPPILFDPTDLVARLRAVRWTPPTRNFLKNFFFVR